MSDGTDIHAIVDGFFREKAAEVVAVLTRMYGAEHLSHAESALQDALIKALQHWPYHGVPTNPGGWIFRVARNRMIDLLRRDRIYAGEYRAEIGAEVSEDPANSFNEENIEDDLLKMMFVCCHPELALTAQIALTMKTLCGLGYAEIGRALFKKEVAVQKILVRAKQRIRQKKLPVEFPALQELPARLDGVLHVLYLLFNEGHSATAGEDMVRQNLCYDAIRMLTAIQQSNIGRIPQVDALLALMLFQASRIPARIDAHGHPVQLAKQDRSLWDSQLIARGMHNLQRSMLGTTVSSYHLQAAIAACHSMAPDHTSTDWTRILQLYDDLLRLAPSPVVAINRVVALSYVNGPGPALEVALELEQNEYLQEYHLFPAIVADLLSRLGRTEQARAYFRRALDLARTAPEQRFLRTKIEECAFDYGGI